MLIDDTFMTRTRRACPFVKVQIFPALMYTITILLLNMANAAVGQRPVGPQFVDDMADGVEERFLCRSDEGPCPLGSEVQRFRRHLRRLRPRADEVLVSTLGVCEHALFAD